MKRLLFAFLTPTLAGAMLADCKTSLAADMYALGNHPTHFYTQAFTSRHDPEAWVVRFGGDCNFEKRIPEEAVVNSVPGEYILTAQVVDLSDFSPCSCDSIRLHIADRNRGNGPVRVQVIGDSFVQGAFYRSALADSCYVPGIQMIGLRRLADSDKILYDEGRGGWTLKDYFTISKADASPYAGFMQPADSRRYLGATGFWKNCHRVQEGILSDFESRYQCGRFQDFASRFDPATGLPLSPRKDDLMWDSEKNAYVCFDGRKWRDVRNEDESKWRFDYPKYLAIWNLDAPDFLFETLGLNDFRDALDVDYSEWDSMAAQMKDSFLKANPEGKFAIVIPCSSCGSMHNRRGDFTIRQNDCMWRFRKHLTDTYSDRIAEGWHLVDMGIAIDNEHGYRTDAEGLQTGNPHPYPNYPEMGMPLAAFIQYWRK